MRLTVGPLPAAVYWRRRAVVLVGCALLILIVFYSCSAATNSSAGAPPAATSSAASASPTTTLLHPIIPTTSAKATATPFILPPNPGAGDCSDAEMSVTARAARSEVIRGEPVDVTIEIGNASGRTCARDVGADVQELRLLDGTGTVIVWSSDDCNPNRGHDVRSFPPGKVVSFTLSWAGRRSRSGAGTKTCGAEAKAPDPASYQLVARLGQKLSAPFSLQITA